ncbi:metallophosphoesterase [Tenacibaculum sp. M341]|uniref:metallophosphoesterase n=1 Tax=Tenacibaculum sp. M341 TaxID=2530339 RepID=UPI00104BE2CA|nr:metallophosphoesterase [Tenacibaculum sp. M341]TCI90737.1 phosphoesterase [Tenacibaculum sp. M341]
MEDIFFTSDHHFGHKNIIKFSNRPFESVEEMDEELIKRWNSKVKPNDRVYHLGDVSLGDSDSLKDILSRLNGKIYLIKGNHEGVATQHKNRFEWIKDYFELSVRDEDAPNGKQKIMLFHYAMKVWRSSFRGTWHLYGHSHGNLPDDINSLSFDVGVDCHDYYPISYQEVKNIMKQKEWTPPFANETR